MKIINKKAIDDFKRLHADSTASINAWVNEAAKAQWKNPMELKSRFPKADTPGGGNTIFNITGNKYRVWCQIAYKTGVIFVQRIGTHKEYDKWDITG